MGKDRAMNVEPFKMGMSIRYKIMLHVVLTIFIALSASTYLAVVTESKVFHTSLIQKGQNLAENIATSTKSAFWSLNWLFVEDLLQSSAMIDHRDIIYSKIVKPNGEIYLANDKKYYGKHVPLTLLKDQISIIKDHIFENERVEEGILLVHPVKIGKDTWYILLGLSTEIIEQTLRDLIFRNVILGALLLLVSSIIMLFVSYSISNPIIDLAHATRRFSDGRLDQFVPTTSRDEIGLLGHSFNKMTESIQDAEKALRASNDRFITVLDSIDATIYVADIDTYEILFMNRSMKKIFGANNEGEVCYKIFSGGDAPCPDCKNSSLISIEGQPTGRIVWERCNPLNKRWYLNYDRAIKWIDDRFVHLQIAFDITKTKELEKNRRETELKLRQSQKMEAIGKLAGGVAHDLNNTLSGIINYPELMLIDLPDDHKLRKPIKNIQKAGERAAAIVNDLLTLARRGVAVSEFVDLNEVIRSYLLSPEHTKILSFHPLVEQHVSLSDNLRLIKGSPIHLSKSVMNLVSNAAEAMPKGGKLAVKTCNIEIEEVSHRFESIQPGSYVLLEVSDQGTGIAEEEQDKIFEPFYTKKSMGRSGTGLGMAVIWGAVKDHFGYIDIKSSLDRGTSFYLYLPSTSENPVHPPPFKNDLLGLNGNGETILVVDDIKEQRDLVSEMLEMLDYTVITIGSGEEAVEYLKTHSVELLILDMILIPGINGLETYKRIIEFKPGQRAIIASGYSESDDVREAQKLGAGQYLRKPYNISALAKTVRRQLAS